MSGFAGVLACGGSAFVSVTRSYTTGTSATETIPTGATNVIVEMWGSTGNGGGGTTAACVDRGGGGAGSGGYAKTVLSAVGGQTVTYTIGVGAASTIVSGTFTITSMTSNNGIGGGNASSSAVGTGSAGGTATGGNTTNTTGNAGANGALGVGGAGGASIVGTNGTGNGGGRGGDNGVNTGRTLAQTGLIIFKYT